LKILLHIHWILVTFVHAMPNGWIFGNFYGPYSYQNLEDFFNATFSTRPNFVSFCLIHELKFLLWMNITAQLARNWEKWSTSKKSTCWKNQPEPLVILFYGWLLEIYRFFLSLNICSYIHSMKFIFKNDYSTICRSTSFAAPSLLRDFTADGTVSKPGWLFQTPGRRYPNHTSLKSSWIRGASSPLQGRRYSVKIFIT